MQLVCSVYNNQMNVNIMGASMSVHECNVVRGYEVTCEIHTLIKVARHQSCGKGCEFRDGVATTLWYVCPQLQLTLTNRVPVLFPPF